MPCKLNRGRTMGKILRALNRENLKHCEKQWRDRQLDKKVSDYIGASLEVGDVVEYRDEEYRIVSINYDREQMRTVPSLSIEPVFSSEGEIEDDVRPSIVRKVMMDDVLKI